MHREADMKNSLDYFNETHQLVRQTTKKFVNRHLLPFISAWEEQEQFPLSLYRLAGEAGLLGIGYPDVYGGSAEGDVFMKVAFTEEIMRCTSGGLVAGLGSIDIALPPIVKWANNTVKQRVVPEVIAGEKIAALAITEANGGSDVANIRTSAIREGEFYCVNGSKMFITSGVRADYYSVAVRTGGEGHQGISLLLIEKGTPGFSVGRSLKKTGWRCSDTAELFFENCMVPAEQLIGTENAGFSYIMSNFLTERLMLTIMAYMTAQLALEESMEYVKTREAFGQSIGKFQVNRHKLVDMATEIDIAREYTYRAAAMMQAGQHPIKQISMAKNFATGVAERATYHAVQLFGGMGYMRETIVERLSRDARLLAIGGGTTEIMKEMIAKQIGL